ncbi:MAG: divergent PAP2 family protein [Candidatus Izimaplasma sp.]|nr:divergent PAP2 family protein [Candidatus Izimaplasma bacterium]
MFYNYPLEIAIISMLSAQLLKLPIVYLFEKKWYPSIIFSTGGMPSSHCAFVSALTLSMGLTYGYDSPYFAISFVIAGVVIHDSIGIRRQAGKHASVLNQMKQELDILFKELTSKKKRNVHLIEEKLKEFLGHEPLEAFFGTLLGIILTLATYFIYIV